MAKIFSIKDPTRLPEIIDLVHDYWFDLDELELEADGTTLRIRYKRPGLQAAPQPAARLRLFKRAETPYVESFLRIHHVRSWSVKDRELIGSYDFNEIRYEPRTKTIRISTGVPLSLLIEVDEFELSVEITTNVAEANRPRSIF